MLVRLYKSMVQPILKYANVIWGPYYVMDQRKVEAIQHRATKLITSLYETDYSTRLTELQLPSLNYRRQRGDIHLCRNNGNFNESYNIHIVIFRL